MIPGLYYLFVYLFIVTVVSLFVFKKYIESKRGKIVTDNVYDAFWIAVLFSIFIGLRPNDPAFADTVGYVASYNEYLNIPFHFSFDVENLLFDNIFIFFASYDLGWHLFFLLMAGIYFLGTYKVCRIWFPQNVLVSYLVFLAAFSSFSYSVNGIKAGVAASLFLLAMAYRKGKPILAILLAVSSWGFHHSMVPCLITFFIVWLYSKPKWYFVFWIVCLILSASHVTFFQILFADYTNEKGARYLDVESMNGWEGRTGFRIDFVLYSILPIIVGLWAVLKKDINNVHYNRLLCSYLMMNGLWLLCMYAGFTNRIAYLSWFMYPFVLVFPFLGSDCHWGAFRFRMVAFWGILHLGFTLFMNIIYL